MSSFFVGLFLAPFALFASFIIIAILRAHVFSSLLNDGWISALTTGILALFFLLLWSYLLLRSFNRKSALIIGVILGCLMQAAFGWHQPYLAKIFYNRLYIGMPVQEFNILLNNSEVRWGCKHVIGDKRLYVLQEKCFEHFSSQSEGNGPDIVEIFFVFQGPGFYSSVFSVDVNRDGKVSKISALGGMG